MPTTIATGRAQDNHLWYTILIAKISMEYKDSDGVTYVQNAQLNVFINNRLQYTKIVTK